MNKKKILFTLNNVRGLRRYIDLRNKLKKKGFKLDLITSSFSTALICKLINCEVIFLLNKNKIDLDEYKNINNYFIKLFQNSIDAEIDQELKYPKLIHNIIFEDYLYLYLMVDRN